MEANTPNRMENHRKKSKQKVDVLTTGITAVWEVMQENTEEKMCIRDRDYAKEWEAKGYRTDIFREEPFVASRDSIEGKYYVMIWKKGFRNQKAKIEEIL